MNNPTLSLLQANKPTNNFTAPQPISNLKPPSSFGSSMNKKFLQDILTKEAIDSPNEVKHDLTGLDAAMSNMKDLKYSQENRWTKGYGDCSTFTCRANKALGKDIGATTFEQLGKGTAIDMKDLQYGDSVFFNTGNGNRHTGIFTGNDTFRHLSSTGGVKDSSLSNYLLSHPSIGNRRY